MRKNPSLLGLRIRAARADDSVVERRTDEMRRVEGALSRTAYGRSRVVFLYHPPHRDWGYATMRVFQACEVLGLHAPDLDVRTASTDDVREVRDATVVLSAGVLASLTPERAGSMRGRGNRLLADFLDAEVRDDLVPHLDGLIASSRLGHGALRETYPGTPVFHLTHLADTRLRTPRASTREPAKPRICYVGLPVNAVLPPAARRAVDLVPVDVANARALSWLRKLPRYNCHYIVRRRPRTGRYKPFLKGFTAAFYEAPVIVEAESYEARHYLGADYPFYVDPSRASGILEGLDRVAEAFGTATWHDAVERMRDARSRSGVGTFVREFRGLVAEG